MKSKFLTALLVLGIVACKNDKSSSSSSSSTSSSENPTEKQSNNKQNDLDEISGAKGEETEENHINVTSTDLWLAYDGNEVRADEDYKGKALKVTGKVMDITKILGDIVVKLEGNPDNRYMNVYCEFSKDHTSEAASLEKDQYVTILGMCKGKPLVDVKLEGCKLMPSDEMPSDDKKPAGSFNDTEIFYEDIPATDDDIDWGIEMEEAEEGDIN